MMTRWCRAGVAFAGFLCGCDQFLLVITLALLVVLGIIDGVLGGLSRMLLGLGWRRVLGGHVLRRSVGLAILLPWLSV